MLHSMLNWSRLPCWPLRQARQGALWHVPSFAPTRKGSCLLTLIRPLGNTQDAQTTDLPCPFVPTSNHPGQHRDKEPFPDLLDKTGRAPCHAQDEELRS